MEKISFVEFKEFPKKEVNKQKLQPGKKYYIQDTSRRSDKFTTVFEGTFNQKNGDWNLFSNVNFVVNPFNQTGKPHGFNNKKGFKFMEVIDFKPTEFEKHNKATNRFNNRFTIKKPSSSPSNSKSRSSKKTSSSKKSSRSSSRKRSTSSNKKVYI